MNGKINRPIDGITVDRCCYRTSDGLMCAIGCHIADEHYNSDLEDLSVSSHNVREALSKSGVHDLDYVFLSCLQAIHDDYEPKYWKEALEKFAKEFGLRFEI